MFDPSKTIVIANPMARHGFVGEHWPELSTQIRQALGPVDLQLTDCRGDGLRKGKEAIARGAQTIVSFGGDGTHSEIVDGIMQSGVNKEVALGILHAGTGGDFRRMIPGADELASAPPAGIGESEVADAWDLLRWLVDDHFTFLGYREYRFEGHGEEARAKILQVFLQESEHAIPQHGRSTFHHLSVGSENQRPLRVRHAPTRICPL